MAGAAASSARPVGPAASSSLGDPGHAPAAALELRQVARLVLQAALGDQVDLRIEALRPLDQAGQGRQLQPDEMLAGQEADEVRGGEDGAAVDELHRRPP